MLKLVKLNENNYDLLIKYIEEWNTTREKIIPYSVRKNDYKDKIKYLENLEIKKEDKKIDLVEDSTWFCLDTDENIFVGAVNIRHKLNEKLLLNGGHIGDGVLPKKRGKGIATKMIKLALNECKNLGINKVLMVCNKDNIASRKTIQKNGGIFENEVEVDGIVEQRFWIELNNN